MANELKGWLRTRVGAIIDFTPETFGYYTRDGTLLAQILHSYDIITSEQSSIIVHTRDPALSRVNLRTLRIWLKLINVPLSDESIVQISQGKGVTSLQLFFKVYLSLEGKDRLHFIALRKERKYIPSSRFDVSIVSEDSALYVSPEHPLSTPLIKAANTVLWYKNKFWAITERCRRERERFEALMEYPVIQPIEHCVPVELPDKKQEESKRLDEFTRKHPARKMKKRYQMVECCPSKRSLDLSYEIEDPATAAEYISFLKNRTEKEVKTHELKLKTQTTMMAEAWERLLSKQDKSFDEVLGRRVLDQSRYEKQMLRKLCEVRDLRNRIVENRKIVDAMLLTARESKQRLKEDRHEDEIKEKREDVEMETYRMRELRQRIREEKVRRMKEKHQEICSEIVNDFVDIAVKIADYRQTNGIDIPNSIWNKWRMSFLQNQPIFELVEYFNDVKEEEDVKEIKNEEKIKINEDDKMIVKNDAKENSEEKVRNEEEKIKIEKELKAEEKQRLTQLELERQRSLDDADFESYRDLASPWDQFIPKRDEETEDVYRLGCVVLGYIVHRLLEILYPYPEVVDCSVPRVKVAAIVMGVTNVTFHEQLRELLKNTGIRLLTMEDAINHCLERYKQEMVNVKYIDLNIISTTTRDTKRLEAKNKTDDSRDRPKKIERSAKLATSQQNAAEEKQTQTPRQIPYDDMDPILSDTAYIGKWTYEFLMLGQPISNELNTKILTGYLKEIGDVEGWVLINYPNTYEQMAMLEKALTGREIPSDPVNLIDVNIENIDSSSPRIVFEDDTLAICRQSRLLPNPISKAKDRTPPMFMTIYIKAMPKPKKIDNQEQPCIPLPDNATSVDEYYANQNIAYGFFYNVLDLPTLKQLVELITDHFHKKELSLEHSEKTYHDKQKPLIDSKAAIIKRLIPKSKWKHSEYDEKKDIEANKLQLEAQTQLATGYVRPGEDGWQWLDLYQPPALLEMLATLWENVEQAYIENLKEIFSLKRMHTSVIIPYKNFVLSNLMRFVDRPDKRQILLQDFHRDFNEIDEDLREDLDMKCELHCRVDKFRTELWELCDARRNEAEEERRRTLRNEWTLMEAVVIVNVYIGILQTEIDRFVDTVQLLQDYYTSMSQKPLQESRFFKIVLDNVELEDVLQETSMIKNKERIANESETKAESIEASSRVINNSSQFKTEIETVLIDVSKSFEPDQNIVYSVIKDNVRQVRETVDSISSMILEMLKKEETATIPKIEIKDKGNASSGSTFAKLARRYHDLVEEWRYAVLFEIGRIHQRLDVLNAAARSDVTFLLDTMRQTFHRVHDYIVKRYKREIESINEMANVFCFAIEEKRPIQEELLLDGDQFVVRPNILMFPEDHDRLTISTTEAPLPMRFRMVQLGRLIDIFRRIAPHGIVSERVLVYILQDLVSCGEEDCHPPFVPCAWRQLRPPDIETLIERLFGTAEYIEWREFILYAMDLPVPSHKDILKARALFRMQDPELREMVTCEQFHSTPLWFLEITTFYENFLDDKLDDSNSDVIKNVMLRCEAQLGERISSLGSDFIEMSEDNSSTRLRLMLAKELLSRLYLVNRDSVHYTAMLLAFCKDENPSEGLGKAFTLAMGARVCTDVVEGERYVEELIEQKRSVKEMKLSGDYLREEAKEIVREILNYIMNKTIEIVTILERYRNRLMIQQLNESDEIDPSELLPPEVVADHLVVKDPSAVSDDYEYEQSLVSTEDRMLTMEDHDGIPQDERVIFWLPQNVCLTVLSTCLPWLASQADLFQSTLSLREGIARVYDELRDEELNDEKDLVLAHRLVDHGFIRELLRASSKFTSRNMADLLRSILKREDNRTT